MLELIASLLCDTSHRLQPLEVGLFGPFKAKLKIAFNNSICQTIKIYNILKLLKLAYFDSFTKKNITTEFDKRAIWPFNEIAFSVCFKEFCKYATDSGNKYCRC